MSVATTAPLDERVVEALSRPVSSAQPEAIVAELEAIAAEVKAVGRKLDDQIGQARTRARDPLATERAWAAARAELDRLHVSRDRISAQEAAISTRVDALRAEEKQAAERAQWEAARDERDALAEELKAKYPVYVGELRDLFARIRENDQHLANLRSAGERLVSAEVIARDCQANFEWPRDKGLGPVSRLTKMRLPAFDRAGDVWPPQPKFGLA